MVVRATSPRFERVIRRCSCRASTSSGSLQVKKELSAVLRRTFYSERCALAIRTRVEGELASELTQCAAIQDTAERMRKGEGGDPFEGGKEMEASFTCTWRIEGRSPRAKESAVSCATTVEVDAPRAKELKHRASERCKSMDEEEMQHLKASLAYEVSLATLQAAEAFECEVLSTGGEPRKISGSEALLKDLTHAVALHMVGQKPRGGLVSVSTRRDGSRQVSWHVGDEQREHVELDPSAWTDLAECLDMMLSDPATLPGLNLELQPIQGPRRKILRPLVQTVAVVVLSSVAGYRALLPWLPALPPGLPGESRLHERAVAMGWPKSTIDLSSLRTDHGRPLRPSNKELSTEHMQALCVRLRDRIQDCLHRPPGNAMRGISKPMLFQILMDEEHKVVGYFPANTSALAKWEQLPFLGDIGKSWSVAPARYGKKPLKAYVLKLSIDKDGSCSVTEWENDGLIVDWSNE